MGAITMTGNSKKVLGCGRFLSLRFKRTFKKPLNQRRKGFFRNSKLRIQNLKFQQFNEGGFTFIELLVVLAVMALLSSLVVAVSMGKIRQTKESALKEDLHGLRKALDDFYADKGKYPVKLQDLVDQHYLRSIPPDPLTDSVDGWQTVLSQDPAQKGGIVDIHSGSEEKTIDGKLYSQW
jgi:general secretion pathway protein G